MARLTVQHHSGTIGTQEEREMLVRDANYPDTYSFILFKCNHFNSSNVAPKAFCTAKLQHILNSMPVCRQHFYDIIIIAV